MSWLLDSKKSTGLALMLAGVCVLALTGCGAIWRPDDYAIDSLQAIREAEKAFRSTNGRYGTLDELTASHFKVPSPREYYYEFTVRVTPTSYVAVAVPTRWKDQSLSLYLDESGVIRGVVKNGEEANAKDPPLKGPGINP